MKLTPALARVAHMPVRTVAKSPGPAADELLTAAQRGRKDWNLQEWQDVLNQLDVDSRTVEEFMS